MQEGGHRLVRSAESKSAMTAPGSIVDEVAALGALIMAGGGRRP
jgi:hypothetical protein